MLFETLKVNFLRPAGYPLVMQWLRWQDRKPASMFKVQTFEMELDHTTYDYWHLRHLDDDHWIIRTPIGVMRRTSMRCHLAKLYRADPEDCVRQVKALGGEMYLLKISEPAVQTLLPKDRDRIYFHTALSEKGRRILEVQLFKRAA